MTRDAEQAFRRAQERGQDILAGRLAKIAVQAKTPRATGFHIPELDADPAADDPTNVWLLADGRLRSRTSDGLIHQYNLYSAVVVKPAVPTFAADPAAATGWKLWFNTATGELRGRLADNTVVTYVPFTPATSTAGGDADGSTPSGTSSVPKPPNPTPKSYRKEYKAQWGQSYETGGGGETGSRLHYGKNTRSIHAQRKIMLGLDYTQIQTDLAGATIRKVEIHMDNSDSWANSGTEIFFGGHKKSTAPGSFSAVRKDVWHDHWPSNGEGKDWRKASQWFGRALRDDTIRGITIDQPNYDSHYGQMRWASFSIAISYTKIP